MIFRVYPSKDTWVTNLIIPPTNIPVTGSNFGQSEILELFKKAPAGIGLTGWAGSSSLGRMLLQFDFTSYQQLTSSLQTNPSPRWRLVMRDARHAETLPSSYDVEVMPLTRQWDEGPGLDEDTFVDRGQANWVQARSNSYWTSAGGDFLTSSAKVFSFDTGREDLDVDITEIVNSWFSGTLTNNGLCVRVSSSLEQNSLSYYVKKFHSRHTNFLDRRPYLEARWDDSLQDDRRNFVYDYSGNLFLYNIVRGVPTNISGIVSGQNCVYLRIVDASGTIASATGSWTGKTGVYSASFVLPTGSYSGSVMHDIWFSGSRSFMTGTFYPSDSFSQPVPTQQQLVMDVENVKVEYEEDERARFRIFSRNVDYNPSYVLTGSSSGPNGLIMTRAYYAIDNDRTKDRVIPFGTGSYSGGTDNTRLSYDDQGNYFDFCMSSLSPGNVYRIVFMVDSGGQMQLVDGGYKFRIR